MSRNIVQRHERYEPSHQDKTDTGKVLITDYRDKICSFLIKDNRLLAVNCLEDDSKIGNIYIAKVKNVVKNIDACFVEIADKEMCFLPLKEADLPFCLNRTYDGRIVQGDEFLVQITRDALKTKQAAVTCNITLQSDYFVFTAGTPKLGMSAKLSKAAKEKIKQLLTDRAIVDQDGQIIQSENVPNYGMIVRTEALKLFEQDCEAFLREFKNCLNEFLQIYETARHRSCFSCIRTRKTPYNAILDFYGKTDYQEVVTDLNEAYTSLQGIHTPIRLYTDPSYSLKKLYALETKLREAMGKTVWLNSGANLVIEQTECLNAIDVNSGKKIKGDLTKDNIWEINKEAAIEAALQIRLRNLSGIILIDFINMSDEACEEQLIHLMKELVTKDNITTNVIDITPLGLMEITRKKVNKSLAEQFRG